MEFIATVPVEEATGIVKEHYDENIRKVGRASEVVRAVSLRPEALRVSYDFRRATTGRVHRYLYFRSGAVYLLSSLSRGVSP